MSQVVSERSHSTIAKAAPDPAQIQNKIDNILLYEYDIKIEHVTPSVVRNWIDDISGQDKTFLANYAAKIGISVYSLKQIKKLENLIEAIDNKFNFPTLPNPDLNNTELKIFPAVKSTSRNSIGIEEKMKLVDAVDLLIKASGASLRQVIKPLKIRDITYLSYKRLFERLKTVPITELKDKNIRIYRAEQALHLIEKKSGLSYPKLIAQLKNAEGSLPTTTIIGKSSLNKVKNVFEAISLGSSFQDPEIKIEAFSPTRASPGSDEKKRSHSF